MINTATAITLVRLAALLPLVLLFLGKHYGVVVVLFILAALSDWVDGWVARKYNQQTPFGAMLDQIGDKLLVLTVLMLLLSTGRMGAAGVLASIIIMLREIWVSGLREYMGSQNVAMPVSRLAKYKTAVQMLAITLLLLAFALPWYLGHPVLIAGTITLLLAAGLGVWTGWQYSLAVLRRG